MPEKKINLIYKLEGNYVDEGVDVFELSPVLLSLGKTIRDSQQLLHPESNPLAINVKPFEKGSFIVDLLIASPSHLNQLIDFVNGDSVKEIKEVLEWLGMVKGYAVGSGIGLIALIKLLKGKPKTVEKLKPGEYRYENNQGESITVGEQTHQLFQNSEIRNSIIKVYNFPTTNNSITNIKTYLKEDDTSLVDVKKEEFKYFGNLEDYQEEYTEQEIIENESELYLHPKRGSYDGQGDNWSFRRSKDPKSIITANVKDPIFLKKVEEGEYRISHTDILKVILKEKQRINISGEIITTYEITKVSEYY